MNNKKTGSPSAVRMILQVFQGALIGLGAVLPGISGGVLCVVFGIYKTVMELLSNPFKNFKTHVPKLLPVIVGGAIGFLGIANLLAFFLEKYPDTSVCLFVGLIAGMLPSLFREAGKEGRRTSAWVSLFACAAAVFAGLFYVGRVLSVTVEPSFWWYNFCGALWGMSVVIPGLTSSSVMMALGLYQPMLEGLARLDLLVLSACLPGMVITMLLLARLVSWFFRRHYAVAYHGILGIVLASTLVIVPTDYLGWWEVALSALCCAGGYALASFLDKLDRTTGRGAD